jgi:saccharopine dehydrogenase (NAD+, L-lysine-forming)
LKTWFEAPPASGAVRRVPFPNGPRRVAAVAMGDLATAPRSTGVTDVTTYAEVPIPAALVRAQPLLSAALRVPAVRRGATRLAGRLRGPDERTRARLGVQVWVRATDASGGTATRTLTGPEGYGLTADAVVRAVRRVASSPPAAGVHTPSSAFGASFVEELDGVTVGVPSA